MTRVETDNVNEVIGDWSKFLYEIFEGLEKIKINVDKFELDHIAYRATTTESFD